MITQHCSIYPFTMQGEESLNKIRKLGTYTESRFPAYFQKLSIVINPINPNNHIHRVRLTSSLYCIHVLFPVHSLLPPLLHLGLLLQGSE